MPELNPSVENQTEATTVTEAPAPTAPKAAKPKAVKTPAKKAAPKAEKPKAVKPAAKKEKTDAVKKDRSMSDLTPVQRATKILVAMRKIGSTNAGSAVDVAAIAKKAGLGEYEVYCAVWSKGLLQIDGYVKQVKVDGIRGAAFHLTAKGQKGDPE